tara:strand:+ start:3030 stop:6107 length:3078 start_codon:yes stop_codon:yes gene_type:complete
MAISFLSSIAVTGTTSVSSISNDNSSYTGVLVWDGTVLKYRTKAQILSDIGATGNTGTVKSVSLGTLNGLSGSVTNSTTTVSIALTNTDKGSAQNIFKNFAVSGSSNVVADSNNDTMTFVASGGMTITTDAASDTIKFDSANDNTNHYVSAVSFSTSNGILTLSRNGLSSLTVDLDGRFLELTGGTLSGNLAITDALASGTPLLDLHNSTNGEGAAIRFCDVAAGTSQFGNITYRHQDSKSYGSAASFTLETGEATTTILANGKLMFKEGIYIKPASGTGAGTRKDANWDTAYNNSITALAVAGTTTKTLTATQQDGGTLTTSWTDNNDNTNYYVTSGSVSSGTVTLNRQGLSTAVTFLINNRDITNGAGYTTNTGTTTASNTQTFTNKSGSNNQWTNDRGYTTNTGTTTAGNTQTFTNKSGSNNQWTNDAGYVTSSGGSMSSWIMKEGNGTETSTVTNGETVTFAQGTGIQSELTSTSGGGTLTITNTAPNIVQTSVSGNAGSATKLLNARTISGESFNGTANITLDNLNITNGQGYTKNTGTTTASNTQTFTNKSGNISQWNNNSGYTTNTGTTTASNSQTFTNKGGNISQWTNDSGYVTSSGGSMSSWIIKEGNGVETATVTNGETFTIAQGTGIQSEMTSTSSGGTITITNTAPNITQTSVTGNAGTATALQTARNIAGVSFNGTANISLDNANITNGAGYTKNTGDITGVTAGTNLSGGGTSGSVTLNMATGGVGAGSYGSTSNTTKIDNITVDAYGRVTGVSTGATGGGNGTVTSVATGLGLTGGTFSTTGTVSVDYGTTGLIADSPAARANVDEDDLVLVGLDSSSGGETVSVPLVDLPFRSSTASSYTNLTVTNTLSVRGAVDLADNDILRFGTGDDCEMFTNGSHMYMDLNAGIGNFYIRDTTTTRFTFDDAGSFTATGNVTAYSDRRLKDNIVTLDGSKVLEMRGVSYTKEGKKGSGVIAQELEEVAPELVHTMDDEMGTKSVAYGNLVGYLIEAVKDQQKQIDELKTKLDGISK